MVDHHATAGTELDDPSLDGTDHLIPSGPADGLQISVVIPCHLTVPFLADCVATLTGQSLPRDKFEAILVFNGPDDGGYDAARELLAESGLHHQLARSSRGISPARNVGTAIARAPWVTLLDVDDSLTPNYLEAMLASATDETIVPVAGIVDVGEDGVETPSHINETILAREGIVDAVDLIRPLSISTLKLVPTEVMRRHPFNPAMRSGEDVALWTDLFEAEGLRFDTTPAFRGARYRRTVREHSHGRQGLTWDFMVVQRLEVIEELTRQQRRGGTLAPIRTYLINTQADFIAQYLRGHPDSREAVEAAVAERGLDDFPWARLPVDRLVIADHFALSSDASAVTALKRTQAWGGRWNVISTGLAGTREADVSLGLISRDIVAHHELLEAPDAGRLWPAAEAHVARGWEALVRIEKRTGEQRRLYSSSPRPEPHLVAALIKARRGSRVSWAAELSEPFRRDDQERQPDAALPSALLTELSSALAAHGITAPDSDAPGVWAQTLAYGLADSLIVTNPLLLAHRRSEIDDPALRRRADQRTTIAPHPTLPPEFYGLGRAPSQPAPGQTHIACFSPLDPAHGLADVLTGLAALAPQEASRLRLHIFAPPDEGLTEALQRYPHRQLVSVYAPVPYLTALSLARGYDALLVSDVATRGTGLKFNPYLPSALSDYHGAGRPIWAHSEPGSMLSREPVRYRSRLGDARSVTAVLSALSSQENS